jgi:hypothetical protein
LIAWRSIAGVSDARVRCYRGWRLDPAPPSRVLPAAGGWPLALLLVATAAIQLLTLPRFEYPGDNVIARAETIQLLQHGRLGIPLAAKSSPQFAPSVRERGQYFYENDAAGLMYSKFGFGYTLLYVPPVAVARALEPSLGPLEERGPLFLIVNLYNVAFAVGVVFYVYRLMSLYTAREPARIALAVAAIYPAYVWYYLRAPTLEIYQLFFFVAFGSHLLAFVREARSGAGGRAAPIDLLVASCCGGFLLLLRPTFGVLFPLIVVVAAAAGPEETLRARLGANLGPRLRRFALAGCAPLLFLAGVWLVINVVRTGSPLDTGYSQWLGSDGQPEAHFTPSVVPAALMGFLLQPGNYNVFLHQPLVLAGLAGLPALFRRHRGEAAVLLAIVVACIAPILVASNWHGEWGYGPRYLVHPLLLLTVPAAFVLERVSALRPAIRRVVYAMGAAVLAASLVLQVQIASVHYFLFQTSADLLAQGAPDARIERWFEEPRLRSIYAWQMKRFVATGAPLAPIELALERVPDADRPRARELLRGELRALGLVEPNWYLARR